MSVTNKPKVAVDPTMLLCAFRYALGRQTYVVGMVAEELIRHKGSLGPAWREQIRSEITRAIAEGDAGHHMDVIEWQRVEYALREEI